MKYKIFITIVVTILVVGVLIFGKAFFAGVNEIGTQVNDAFIHM